MTRLPVPVALRLLRSVYPAGEPDAVDRWREAARQQRGERAEVRALLATALAVGAIDEEELEALGLEPTVPEAIDVVHALVLRRHGEPDRSGRLSSTGLASCAALAPALLVAPAWSSDLPRAVETAVALGGHGAATSEVLRPPPVHVERLVGVHLSFAAWAAAAASIDAVRSFTAELARAMVALTDTSPAVVICHDDTVQAITVGLVGEAAASLGPALGHLEGVAISMVEPRRAVRLGAPPA